MWTRGKTLRSKDTDSGSTSNKAGETIDQFITELKTRAKSCEFCDQHDSMIRDRIVFGVTDTWLKERLLRESSDLTLEKASSLCRAAKVSKN